MLSIVKSKVNGEDGFIVSLQVGKMVENFATTKKEEILALLDKLS